MTTELVTFKMDSGFLKEVDKSVKQGSYHNRTEFIREALRQKVDEVKLKKIEAVLNKYRGKAPRQTTDEERAKVREQVFMEFEKKFRS